MIRRFISILTLCAFLSVASLPLALAADSADRVSSDDESPFGSNWQPRPLLDPQSMMMIQDANSQQSESKASAAPPEPTKPVGPTPVEINAHLKPVQPFVEAVEKKLGIAVKKKKGQPKALLQDRLNHIQQIVYGEKKYKDAGTLLAELAKVFPDEAAQARQNLMSKIQQQALTPKKQTRTASADTANPMSPFPSQRRGLTQERDDWQDEPDRAERGGALKSIGSGLANLAVLAGSLAGQYYANRNWRQNQAQLPPGYYQQQPYGYNPYNTQPGFGYNAYNYNPYGVGTYSPYGYYQQPYTYRY